MPTHGWDQLKMTERIRAVCSCFCKRAPCEFCHLSCFFCQIKRTNACSSPISGSERPDSQAKQCVQSRLVISHCLTAPHSSNHKDSQMLLRKKWTVTWMHENSNQSIRRWSIRLVKNHFYFWLTDVAKQVQATSVSVCGCLSVGQLNKRKWPACFARTVCLRTGSFRAGNRAGTSVRSWFGKRSTTNGKIRTVLVCKNNCKLL